MPCEVMRAVPGVGGDISRLAAFSECCAGVLGRAQAEWCVVLADDAFIAALNNEYRAIPTATDVLSFPQADFPDGANVGDAAVLGDVVISVETATRQAAEQGHDLQSELEILTVHGLCHLLGWDHETDADAAAMRAMEAEVLKAAGRASNGLIQRAATS